MKKIFTVIQIVFCVTMAHAQNPQIQVGEEVKQNKEIYWADMEHITSEGQTSFLFLKPYETKGGFLTINLFPKSPSVIAKLDEQSLNIVQAEKFPLEFFGEKLKVEKVLMINKKLYAFYSFINKKEDKVQIYRAEVNRKTLKLAEQPVLTLNLNTPKEKFKEEVFVLKTSNDGSKFYFGYSLVDKQYDIVDLGFRVYDKNFQTINQWQGSVDESKVISQPEQVEVANDGTVYGLIKQFASKKEYKNGGKYKKTGLFSGIRSLQWNANYGYQLAEFRANQPMKIWPIIRQGQFVNIAKIQPLNDGVMVGGFYGANNLNRPVGMFVQKYDAKGELLNEQLHQLPQSFTQPSSPDTKTKSWLSSKKKLFAPFTMNMSDVVLCKDGSVVFSGERWVRQSMTQTNGNGQTVTIYYHQFDDIALLKVTPEGNVEQFHKIEKHQQIADGMTRFGGYNIKEEDGKLYCFYINTNKKSKVWPKAKRISSHLVTIDEQANKSKNVIFSTDQHDIALKSDEVYWTASNELVMLTTQSPRKWKFVKFKPSLKFQSDIGEEE